MCLEMFYQSEGEYVIPFDKFKTDSLTLELHHTQMEYMIW